MKKHIAVMLVITLLLGQIMALPSLSADADTIIISTGAKFKEVMDVAANYGKTFIIEGTETLADGSKGIIIPNTYTAKSTFYGTFIGVDGKNNIQTETHLYNSVTTANGPVLFENIIFKGKNTDGTGTVIASSNGGSGGAILVGQVAVGTEKITFKDITNYINVETGTNSIASLNKVSAGSILGYSNIEAPVEFINCINYGNITNLCSDSTRHSGGIVGLSQKAGGTLLINSCHNYGNVSSLTGSSGGIIGSRANLSADDLITNCSNFGTITSNASSGTLGAGGIAGSIMNVSYSFNAGAVESKMMAGGILGFSSVATVKVNDCFNVGSVTSTDTTNAYFAGGIAGSYAGALYTIENCYNAGAVSGEGAKQIGDTKTAVQDTLCVNNYYVSDEDLGEAIGTNITSTELSAALPTDFDTSKWEFRSAEFLGSNNYLYPQIKGNLYDHKFKLNYKDFANYRSETNGTVSGVTVIDNFNKTTSIYTDVSTTVDTYLTYPGLIGSTLILNESTNTSQGIEFTASKTAEIILALNKNPENNQIAAVENGGFKPLNFNNGTAGLITSGGEEYYLYKKNVLAGTTVTIDAGSELTKGYAVFVNWVDSYSMTFTTNGNETLKIDNTEKTDSEPVTVMKGTYYNIEVTPKQNYYIKSITLNGEKIAENIVDGYQNSFNANKNMEFVIETSEYLFVDSELNDDIFPPSYTLVPGLGAGNTILQTFKVEGKMEEFLAGGTVTCTLSKQSLTVYEKAATIGNDGSFKIEFPLLDTDTGVFDIAYTITVEDITSDVTIHDSKKTYDVPSVADVNALLTKLNNDNITADDFTSLVLEERASLPFETGLFKHLDETVQTLISEAFITYDDFAIDNIYDRFNEEVILKTANNSEKSDDFKRLINVYGVNIGIDNSSFYANYTKLLSTNPEPVYTVLKERTYQTFADILNAFEYGVVFAELSTVTSYDSIIDILGTYKTFLDIETEVTSINNMVDAKIKIVNDETGKAINTLTTKELLKSKLQYLIANADSLLLDKMGQTVIPSRPPAISGGGGGGGGGGTISVDSGYVETETVTPIPTVESINDFDDLGVVPWAQDSIRKLLYEGIVRGKESGKFYPQDTVTRAEFVKMAVVAFDLMVKEPDSNFIDVPNTHWSYSYVGSAAKAGIVSGYSKNEFGVDGHITRQDMVAILIRVTYRLGLYEQMEQRKEKLVTFTDEKDIADYAVGGVNMLSGCGIISGYEDGSFGPEKELTRAEAATVLARYLDFFEI